MSDPFKQVRANEPFRPQAEAWNAFIDTAVAWKQSTATGGGAVADATRGWVLVQNVSGEDLERWDAVGINQPVYKPDSAEVSSSSPEDENQDEFENNLAFEVQVPGSCHTGRFAILLEAIPDGEFGRAVVSGVIPTLVDFGDDWTSEAFADVEAGSTILAKGFAGSAQILWAEDAKEGVCWAVVRLSNNPNATLADACTSSETPCVSKLAGVRLDALPILDGADVAYFLAVDADGCLGRIAPAECDAASSSGA